MINVIMSRLAVLNVWENGFQWIFLKLGKYVDYKGLMKYPEKMDSFCAIWRSTLKIRENNESLYMLEEER